MRDTLDFAKAGSLDRGIEHGPTSCGTVNMVSPTYLRRQEDIELNARTYPRRLPIVLKSGRGIRVTDVDGHEYFDCLAGAGALALGHAHPVVTDAIHLALSPASFCRRLIWRRR